MNIDDFLNSSPNYRLIMDYRPDVQFTYGEIQAMFDFLTKMINCSNPKFTVYHHVLFIDNYEMISSAKQKIDIELDKCMSEDTRKKIAELNMKKMDILYKYVDRDEQGKPIWNEDKSASITENLVEFNNDIAKLEAEYAPYIQNYINNSKTRDEFINTHSVTFKRFLMFNEFEKYNGLFTPAIFSIYLSKYK